MQVMRLWVLSTLQLTVFGVLLSLVGCGGGTSSGPGSSGGSGGGGGGGTGGGSGSPPPIALSRSHYIRTDAVTEYYQWINSHWMVYNPATSRLFVTDPFGNHLIVFDTITQSKIATINVPGAYGIDDTPDHLTLYVGSLPGDVYTIDAVALTVTHRYIASQIGPYGFAAINAYVLADGRVALLGSQGGIPSVDGSTTFAIWNPVDNSIVIYGGNSGSRVPCGLFFGNIGGFTRTPDRTTLVFASIDSDGTLCSLNEATGAFVSASGPSFTNVHLTMSPDGKYLIVPGYPGAALLYDPKTLDQLGQFSVNGDTSTAAAFVVSADSTTLYTATDSIVYAYDLSSHRLVGWFPNVVVEPTQGGGAVGPPSAPNYQYADASGLLVGPLEEGIAFVDSKPMQTGPVGTQFLNAYLNPATGPVSGGTATQWTDPNAFGTVASVYFENVPATSIHTSNGVIAAVSPAGIAGPADIHALTTDGGAQLLPEAFSYGPTILEVTPDKATLGGGGIGIIYGYGFGPVNSSNIPSDLQISVGGATASVVGFSPNAYNLASPPFPLQAAAYTIPPGTPGTADVTVTTSSGSTIAHSAFSYLPAIQQYSLASSLLAQGIYDPYRDVYYFTDSHVIQVFSRSLGTFLPPINIPPASGRTQRLWGLALSPDGTKLAISDSVGGIIYVLNPTNPSSIANFDVSNTVFGGLTNPCGLVITNSGIVYFAVFVQGITGADAFYKLNTTNGTITDLQIQGPGLGTSDANLRAALSSDDSRVFFNDLGYVFSIDTATDTVFSTTFDPGCCYGDYDLSLSSNQIQLEATSYIYDSDLNPQSYYSLNDREILNISYVYGSKVSPDGSLIFQPSSNGIDVLDGRLGMLQTRISLPLALSTNYDALVTDGKDNILIAITGANGTGIAVVDLSSVPEPAPLPYSARFTRSRSAVRRSSVLGPGGTSSHRRALLPHTIRHLTNQSLLR